MFMELKDKFSTYGRAATLDHERLPLYRFTDCLNRGVQCSNFPPQKRENFYNLKFFFSFFKFSKNTRNEVTVLATNDYIDMAP